MVSNEIKKAIIDLYSSGKTMPYICKSLNIPKSIVSYYINKEGISRYKVPVEITEELLKEMQNRYDECKDLKIVSKEFNISINRLKALRRRPTLSKYEILKSGRYRIKQELVDYKGGKCQICGYSRCLSALEFHHLDPLSKDFGISSNTRYNNIETLKKEADKCILVCSNCHREIHAGLIKPDKI